MGDRGGGKGVFEAAGGHDADRCIGVVLDGLGFR